MNTLENESSNFVLILTAMFMIATAILSYLFFDGYMNKYQLSKSGFICTKIEQVGKNLDDVICVQYTAQKHSKEAVALNSLR